MDIAGIGNKKKFIKGKKLCKKGQHMMISSLKMSKGKKKAAHRRIKRA